MFVRRYAIKNWIFTKDKNTALPQHEKWIQSPRKWLHFPRDYWPCEVIKISEHRGTLTRYSKKLLEEGKYHGSYAVWTFGRCQ